MRVQQSVLKACWGCALQQAPEQPTAHTAGPLSAVWHTCTAISCSTAEMHRQPEVHEQQAPDALTRQPARPAAHLHIAIICSAAKEWGPPLERAAAVDKVVMLGHLFDLLPGACIPGPHRLVWRGRQNALPICGPVHLQDCIFVACSGQGGLGKQFHVNARVGTSQAAYSLLGGGQPKA